MLFQVINDNAEVRYTYGLLNVHDKLRKMIYKKVGADTPYELGRNVIISHGCHTTCMYCIARLIALHFKTVPTVRGLSKKRYF